MSGEIDITATYEIPGDGTTPVTVAMLNQLVPGILAQIAKGAVTARELAEGSISADKLDADITGQLSAGLPDGAVTTAKLAAGAVTEDRLADAAVDAPKLSADQVWEAGDYKYSARTSITGWLRCEGQAVSRTTYADLFAAIGTTFGAGDGSTTFNLPDFRGGTIYCVGDPGVTDVVAKTLGLVLGPDKHAHAITGDTDDATLAQNQLPAALTGLSITGPSDGGTAGGAFWVNKDAGGATATLANASLTNPGGGQGHSHGAGTLASDQQQHTPRGVAGGYLFIKT